MAWKHLGDTLTSAMQQDLQTLAATVAERIFRDHPAAVATAEQLAALPTHMRTHYTCWQRDADNIRVHLCQTLLALAEDAKRSEGLWALWLEKDQAPRHP